jgi:uroporphyrinogen III methyltransferase/synthase
MSKAKVYLVGAGPGDPKLISVKGRECISKADCLVYDRLVDKRLLAYARPEAEMVYVGKAARDHTLGQDDINLLLVAKAQEGKTVVRLKGGDPFIFGRGGEEALKLAEASIPFEVVPGVSSAIAVPAYAGIPVTHRGIATSFTVITGHEDPAKPESALQWEHIAQGADTLVFLMGMENLSRITAKLIEHGRSSSTPAAVIRWGTKAEQEVLVTTLDRAASDVAANGLKPPAIFLVGEVVALRQKLAWFDNRPLSGKTILVTRAREQASALTNALEELGAECIEAPAIKIMPPESYDAMDAAIASLKDYDWLIFTSVNGVEFFFARLHQAGLDARALGRSKVAAVGSATAERLWQKGILADLMPTEFQAEGILADLSGRIATGMRVLMPRAAVARDLLPQKLREMGVSVDTPTAYRTVTGDSDGLELAAMLAAGEIDLITFTSSSTVTNLLNLLGKEGQALIGRVNVACIGPVTAGTCLEKGIRPDVIAEKSTIAGLVDAIENFYRGEAA